MHSVFVILEYRYTLLHVRAFLAQRKRDQSTIHQLYDGPPFSEYVIKKGRPHGHQYGKKPGDKDFYTANQLKKKCKKRDFQGIHDRSIRDQEFRIRMIENHRDEDLCRRWDALADEDHTHHLTAQGYLHFQSKWWLHSNKQGSNTMPLRHRPDFKQALSTLQRLQTRSKRRTTCAYLL